MNLPAVVLGQDIIYNGETIDFGTHSISTLYEGDQKILVADKLDVKGISSKAKNIKNHWYLEFDFRINEAEIAKQDIWIQLRGNVNASEVYLNNHLLLTNGVVGNSKETEIGGKCLVRARIPKQFFISGKNKIQVRFSNYKFQEGTIFKDLSIGKYTDFEQHSRIMTAAPLWFSGVFLLAVFIHLALFFALNKKKVFLLLASLFFINFLWMAFEVLYWNGLISANAIINNITLRSGLEYLVYIILSSVVIIQFELNRQYIYYTMIALVLIFILSGLISFPNSFLLSLIPIGVSLVAVKNKTKHSVLISISLFLLSLFILIDNYNLIEHLEFVHINYIITSFVYKLDIIGMFIFAIVMVYISSKSILEKTLQLNKAKLKLQQLEYQFLQKHIQPHFINNSLMSLQHLVIKDPEAAVKLIDALSEEFHLVTAMSKKKLIPLEQEIQMCKIHLKIISIQQRAKYHLKVIGIEGNETIPPAIIHTLIENGITHGYNGNQDAYFELKKESNKNGLKYILFNDGSSESVRNNNSSGLGLNYVKSRLEESYPDKWQLQSGQTAKGWETIIEIQND